MKKLLSMILLAVMILTFAGCEKVGKSEAAQDTDDLIAAIGTVTLDSESKILAAEKALDSLSEEDREFVENEVKLIAARSAYDDLVKAQQKKELEDKAAKIIDAIAAIGTVTEDSQAVIADARDAYDAADTEVQALVDNLSVLEEAEDAYLGLQAQSVITLIDAIGAVTLESEESINTASDALAALSDDAAAKVSNVAVLETAINDLQNLKAQYAQSLLASMRLSADPVRGMEFYYPMAFPYYTDYWGADVRCFVLPYLGRQGNDVWLRLVCNYTDDDWVFFDKITFAVDDERYYDSFNYFDVTRDNDSGDVWEYVDLDVYDSDIEMLWAIANSNQTIIRFEGDNYYHDFTVTAEDKQAIREILTVYEALGGGN